MDPPQGTAEWGGGASGKVYVRKGKTPPGSEEISVRNSPEDTKVRAEGREEMLQVWVQRLPYNLWEGHTPEQGKSVEEKEQPRVAAVHRPQPRFTSPGAAWRGTWGPQE